jgi:hypothetical protein
MLERCGITTILNVNRFDFCGNFEPTSLLIFVYGSGELLEFRLALHMFTSSYNSGCPFKLRCV